MPSNILTRFATDDNVSELAKSCAPTYEPAQVPPVHTATSRRINLHCPPRRTTGKDMPARRREAAALEPQLTIRARYTECPLIF